jgi:hypothetical protein
MATINELGNIRARCPGCDGALASFTWQHGGNSLSYVFKEHLSRTETGTRREFRLFECGGCGNGAFAVLNVRGGDFPYPLRGSVRLIDFYPEAAERLVLPDGVPAGLKAEFDEGEVCLENNCLRAAAALFRSVVDKTLRANGYKLKPGTNLEQQINLAADDGVITAARRRRVHDEIRTLGNDVLHEEWREVSQGEVESAREYARHLLNDFYDDRETVLALLREKMRVPDEDKPQAGEDKPAKPAND